MTDYYFFPTSDSSDDTGYAPVPRDDVVKAMRHIAKRGFPGSLKVEALKDPTCKQVG